MKIVQTDQSGLKIYLLISLFARSIIDNDHTNRHQDKC